MIWTIELVTGNTIETQGSTYAVPQPVGSGGESNTTGTDRKREDLANQDPSTRTPGGGEEENVDTDEGNHGLGCVVAAIGGTDDGDDELADNHAQSTPDQKRATSESLNGPEGDGSGAHVDESRNETNEERV